MYIIFPIFLLLLLFLAVFMRCRRQRIIRLVCSLTVQEKLCRLNELLGPFGFEYQLAQDIFVSRRDAWQREYGYCRLYDVAAPGWGMLFDCEPIYFDYQGHTWLIEFWKGQYGINIGAEAGIYRSHEIVPANRRASAIFHTIPDEELPVFDLELRRGTVPVCRTAKKHWWLACFRMGTLEEPEMLSCRISITFPHAEMQAAFLNGCREAGLNRSGLCVCDRCVSFTLNTPHSLQPRAYQPLICAWTRLRNRFFLYLYRKMTAPFCCTPDRLLYLYEYLPSFFRRTFCRRKRRLHRKGTAYGRR